MFAEFFEVKLGDTTVKGRRLSLREIQEHRDVLLASRLDVDKCAEFVRSHVELAGGGKIDPYELTPGQMRRIVGELVLPEEGRGISDFIGLLS